MAGLVRLVPAIHVFTELTMVALKGSDIDRFAARPDPARPIVLVFGPDAGLVRERTQMLIRASVDDPQDPFQLARLDGDEIEPTRLVEEANTIPLFGGRRAVWVKAGSRNLAPAVEALLASPAPDCRVVIEAGDLKRSAPLRVLCARAKKRVELEDVMAVTADASTAAVDGLVDAAFAGRPGELEVELRKARTAGTAAGTVLSAALRQVAQLHKARLLIEDGASVGDATGGMFVHFSRRAAVEAALRSWTSARLERAMAQLAEAALEARRQSALADVIAPRTLLALAVNARRKE